MYNRTLVEKNKNKGFTLIEMMVAVSIFSIVVTISMGAIFTIVDANKKAQSLEAVMSNLNFSLETMTRTIKTGQINISDSFSSGTLHSDHIKVLDSSGNTVTYTFVPKSGNILGYINRSVTTSNQSITAPEVDITKLDFINGTGGSSGGGKQPSIVMIVQGRAQLSDRVFSDFNIQTTITQRLPATN